MLNNSPWYFSLIRKYVTLLGTTINNISILREHPTDSNKNELIKIPLTYSPKEKVLVRLNQDPNIDREFAAILPMISFELISLQYDVTRKTNSNDKITIADPTNPSKKKYQFNPVPYNFNFKVCVYVKNTEDGTKIIEQILPMFTPDITLTTDLVPEIGIRLDVPIVLNAVEMEDIYEGDFKQRKQFIWNLSFTVKGYLYGPIRSNSVIKFAHTNVYVPSTTYAKDGVGNTNVLVNIIQTPGMLANGSPTSNSLLSISPLLINIDDDWGYCEVIEEH